MPFLVIYLIKLSVSLAAIFLFYQLALRRLTFYNWNRWYLLGYTILAFFIPFIDISPVLQQNAWADKTVIQWVPLIDNAGALQSTAVTNGSLSLWQIAGVLMLTG